MSSGMIHVMEGQGLWSQVRAWRRRRRLAFLALDPRRFRKDPRSFFRKGDFLLTYHAGGFVIMIIGIVTFARSGDWALVIFFAFVAVLLVLQDVALFLFGRRTFRNMLRVVLGRW
jgi:hypothetical protein